MDLLRKLDKIVSVRTLCQQYNIGTSTVYDIKKQKNQLSFTVSLTVRRVWRFVKYLEGKSSDLDSGLSLGEVFKDHL